MRARTPIFLVAGLGGALLGGAGAAQDSEEAPRAPRLVLDYSFGFEADTNERLTASDAETTFSLDQRVGLSFRSDTRRQSLAFDTDLLGRVFSRDGDIDSEFKQGSLDLRYERAASRSRLVFDLSYRQTELTFSEPFFLDLDGDTIIDEAGFSRRDGTLSRTSAVVALETGLDRPFSTTYRLRVRDRAFSDSGDPDLFDSQSYSVGIVNSLRFSPVLSGRVTTDYRHSDYDNIEEREADVASISFGASYAVNPLLSLSGSIGFSRQEETETIDGRRVESVDDGLNLDLDINRDLVDGTLFASASRSVQDDGFRSTFSIGRSFELPRGSLSASFGVTALEDADPGTVFSVVYGRDFAAGALSASIQRRVTSNTLDEENVLTSADVNYSQRINETTSFGLNLDVARIEETGEEEEGKRTELALTASVQRALTRDWSLDMGYRGRYNDREDRDSATSNAVFVELGRSFIIRP